MTHELKTWPEFYELCLSGKKSFEYRKADRDFKVGDLLLLKEWNPKTEEYTGRERHFCVKYVLAGGSMGIPDGYCVMSII